MLHLFAFDDSNIHIFQNSIIHQQWTRNYMSPHLLTNPHPTLKDHLPRKTVPHRQNCRFQAFIQHT